MNYTYLKKGKLLWVKISTFNDEITSVSRGYNESHVDRDLPDEEAYQLIGMPMESLKIAYNKWPKETHLISALQSHGFKRKKEMDKESFMRKVLCFEKVNFNKK